MRNAALKSGPYDASDTTIRSERSIEYQAFAKATSAMVMYEKRGSPEYGELSEIVHKNRQLWNVLGNDVLSEGNELPAELRASIFSLSQFVAQHSAKVLKKEASLDTLVELNKTIMRGLG